MLNHMDPNGQFMLVLMLNSKGEKNTQKEV